MLYISRLVGMNKVAIMDTDDGVETIVTRKEVREYVLKSGLDIKGVTLRPCIKWNRPAYEIDTIGVYQDASTVSKSQAKLNIMSGVEIKKSGDMIVSIRVDKSTVFGTVIRLSDYGTSCGDYVFSGDGGVDRHGVLTVVLDDKIKLSTMSLRHAYRRGIIIDAREVRYGRTVECILKEILDTQQALSVFREFIIDNESRMDYYIGNIVVCRQYNMNPKVIDIADVVSNADEVNKLIARRFRSEFISISNAQYHISDRSRWYSDNGFFAWLEQNEHRLDNASYSVLRNERFIEVFEALMGLSSMNRSVLTRFKNYVNAFDVTPELQEAYVRLCRKGCRFALEYARSHVSKE